jgi:glutamate-1-semialdehyde 2,1-aminomutase
LDLTLTPYALATLVGLASTPMAWQRLKLSRAKHRSLTGHSKMASRIARWMPRVQYGPDQWLAVDGAPVAVVQQRQAGFAALKEHFLLAYPRSRQLASEAYETISDLKFTSAYRVPPHFSAVMREAISNALFVDATEGVRIRDVDGNWYFDLAGSYGVNVLGYDTYKDMIQQANRKVADLGPVLGAYHPIVIDNAQRIAEIAGLDEVSFHMSGTEAVMQAVRLARYHTGKRKLVRFCGAYHGWWGDVQPGVGNPVPADHTYTLADMSHKTLAVLASRDDIACVLVNPLQALHPNRAAPSDSSLIDGSRSAHFDKAAYTEWLKQLREVCTARGIVLIFDEVFLGFRLAKGGAQDYFGVRADLVTYGKTLGGGLPIGVVCGHASLMKRYREQRPADICFARGTFNSHPYVMAAMQAFLDHLDQPHIADFYAQQDAIWDGRAERVNAQLTEAGVPVRVANMASVWTVLYTIPSRYHWLYQYYLRQEGLALSWVGSGRFIFSLNYTEADMEEVSARMVRAAVAMQQNGWWWHDGVTSNRQIRRQVLWEMVQERVGLR